MATYAVGDIQGCFEAFTGLLKRIRFHPDRDELWLAGDLVNRGPDSLGVLRWAYEHRHQVTAVLGNHDLWLLRCAFGRGKPRAGKDTFQDVLDSPDRERLLEWLLHRPLLVRRQGWILVHAGLHPRWTVEQALGYSRLAESRLTAPEPSDFLEDLFRDTHQQWDPAAAESRRVAAAANLMTRIRVCREDGTVDYGFSDGPGAAPPGYRPWYEFDQAREGAGIVLFGHWAAHGHRVLRNAVALDSGCVWGQCLTAYRLEDGQVFRENCGKKT